MKNLLRTLSSMCPRILITSAYINNSSNIERNLMLAHPKTLTREKEKKNNFKAFYATQKCKNAINLISNRLVLVNDEEIAKTLDKYFCNIAKRL